MGSLLHVSASPRSTASHSRRAGRALVERLGAALPGLGVTRRDLADPALANPDEAFALASLMAADARGPAERAALALSEALIGEIEAADLVVIDTPMHNFTVPACLKAWIDFVVRPRRTFGFRDGAKVGLLRDRPVLAVVACGGGFDAGAGGQADFLSPYLRHVLGTIGLARVEILRLERLGRGADAVAAAFAGLDAWAEAQLQALAPAGRGAGQVSPARRNPSM